MILFNIFPVMYYFRRGRTGNGARFNPLNFVPYRCGTLVLAKRSAMHSRVGNSPLAGSFVEFLSPVVTIAMMNEFMFWWGGVLFTGFTGDCCSLDIFKC